MAKSLENIARVGGTIIGVSFIPEAAALASKLAAIPAQITSNPELVALLGNEIPRALLDASEKWYTLGGMAAGFALANKDRVKERAVELVKGMNLGDAVEKVILGGGLFTLSIYTGDNLARLAAHNPIEFLTGVYDLCYTTAGAGVIAAATAFNRAKSAPIQDAKDSMINGWQRVKGWAGETRKRQITMSTLALMAVGYQFLPETTKALLHPRRIASEYRFVSGPPASAGKDERLLWVWDTYQKEFKGAGKRHNLDSYLLAGMTAIESSGDCFAVSATGAKGCLQLIPGTAERMGLQHDDYNPVVHYAWSGGELQPVSRLCRKGAERMCYFASDPSFDSSQNIEAGAKYLKMLADKRGDIKTALIGKSHSDRKETYRGRHDQGYYNKIINNRDRIRQSVSRR